MAIASKENDDVIKWDSRVLIISTTLQQHL